MTITAGIFNPAIWKYILENETGTFADFSLSLVFKLFINRDWF